MDMQVQGEIGEEYGLYHALLNASLILNVFLDLGLSNYNNRKVAVKNDRFSYYFQNIAIIRLSLAVLYLLFLQGFGLVLNYSGNSLWWLFLIGLSQVFLASLLYVRSNFTAFGKFKLDSLFSVLDRVLMIAGVLYLFSEQSSYEVNIENFIYVQLIGYGVSFLLGLFVLLMIGKPSIPKIEKRFAKTLLKKSTPYALIVLLMTAYHSSDGIMIERMLVDGKWQNAIYAQSFRILMALNNYAYLFAVLLLPMFAKQLGKKENVQSLLATSSSVLIYGVSAIAILFTFYANEIIAFCYGAFEEGLPVQERLNQLSSVTNIDKIKESAEVFELLILGIIPMSVNYCFGTLITAAGNMKILNRIAFVSLVLNILLNYILIPLYGAYGAALASLVTQSASGIGQVIFAVKLFKLSLNIKGLVRFFTGIALVGCSVLYLNELELIARLILIGILLVIGLVVSVDLNGVLKMAKGLKS